MVWTILYIIEIVLWIIMACSVLYVAIFAFANLFNREPSKQPSIDYESDKKNSFLILFPAYNEDTVIYESVTHFLKQQYPSDKYCICVISDHMSDDTNKKLEQLPIKLEQPVFDKSTKAKALQYAIGSISEDYDYVIILDADNLVDNDFLLNVNHSCNNGYKAIQCHRCAKNCDNEISRLDGISEEINNTLFRKAHNFLHLSSALIGSGMCFEYDWFKNNVNKLSTAGEDRELEQMLLLEKRYIKYEDKIYVMDEKVSDNENFQNQRRRWISAQINTLLTMLPNIPRAIMKGNIDYIDKTIQQALIPRSMLIVFTFFISFIMTIIAPASSLKWWTLTFVICISLFIAIPSQMQRFSAFKRVIDFLKLTLRMIKGIVKIDIKSKEFIHTKHNK